MDFDFIDIRGALGPWWFAWAVLGTLGVVATVVQLVGYGFLSRVAKRERVLAETAFLRHTRLSTIGLAWVVAALVSLPFFPFDESQGETAFQILRALLVGTLTWVLIGAIAVVDDLIMARHDVSVRDNLRARQMHTRARVLTRTVMLIVGVAGAAAALMSFPAMRQVGTGLLASAGIVGVAVGFAAKPTLGNLIAGLQIAITEPIRLDDAVIVDGEWGWIEEITATYVVIKIWDQRRLIVPLSKFIEESFQNWTRRRADIIGSVVLFVDYTCPVDEMRAELDRIVDGHPKWDGRVKVLQVIDATERTMQLRALVSAGDSPSAWDLRCDVRERLIAWLQRERPESLPRIREMHHPGVRPSAGGSGGASGGTDGANDPA